jgi:hypothetical protein
LRSKSPQSKAARSCCLPIGASYHAMAVMEA